MKLSQQWIFILGLVFFSVSCNKDDADPVDENFSFKNAWLDNRPPALAYKNVSLNPVVRLSFSSKLNTTNAKDYIFLLPASGGSLPINLSFENGDSIAVVTPQAPLEALKYYCLSTCFP